MCKKLFLLISLILLLGSVSNAEDIQWTGGGRNKFWGTAANWDLGRLPTLDDEVRIDAPAAAAPNGPIIQDGIDAKAKGIFTEEAGEPTLTMTGGTLEVSDYIWWGDGMDSYAVWTMSGGTVTVANEFELGWGGGAGTLTMTGGTINTGEAVIPTGSGAFGELYLHGGTYNVTKPGGLDVKENGLIDITDGTLILEGDDTAKINDLAAAGLITALGGEGILDVDYNIRNAGKTTVTGILRLPDPMKPSTVGLVAYYAFEGDVNDSSGNGLHGTIAGDPTFAEGSVGMALDFDGDGDYVDCGNPPEFTITEQISFAYWIKVRAFDASWNTVIAKGDDSWRSSRAGENNFMEAAVGGTSGNYLYGVTPVDDEQWHHVAAVYDGATFKLFVDGQLDASEESTGQINVSSHNVCIGENLDATGRFWNGLIDEVMIYNRALSAGEVMYLAGERAIPADPGSSGLLALWTCDEGEGAVVADASGNGRDGTFVNGDPAWVEGVSGSAVELVGPTLIETPPLDMELTEATMAGWVKPYGPQPDWSSIIMQRDPGLATGFNILGYQLAYHWNDTSDSWSFRGGDMIAEDDWTFAAVTIQPDQARFFVNGEAGSVNKISHAPCLWNSNVYLGGDGTAGWVARRMVGALDDVAIYDRALSAGEILYLAGFRMPIGLVHSWTFDDGTANDTVGNADGTLVGDATVIDGQLVLDGDGDWMDMPGDVIAMNTYDGLTIEIKFTPVAGGNTGFHMVTAFGEEGTGENPGYGYKYVCITPARGDNVSRAMIQTVSMDGDPWNEETGVSDVIEHDDGLPHHMVCTIDKTELTFYIDGVLIGTAALDPPGNSIAGLGTDVARIGKGVYGVDPLWAGSVDYLNLYNRALSEEEILFLAGQ